MVGLPANSVRCHAGGGAAKGTHLIDRRVRMVELASQSKVDQLYRRLFRIPMLYHNIIGADIAVSKAILVGVFDGAESLFEEMQCF